MASAIGRDHHWIWWPRLRVSAYKSNCGTVASGGRIANPCAMRTVFRARFILSRQTAGITAL